MSIFRPNFSSGQLPTVTKNLLIINGLFFLFTTFGSSEISNFIIRYLALFNVQSDFFIPSQMVSYMFLHGGFTHIFFNMFILWMFGTVFENIWGQKHFLTYYLICGIGAALTQQIAQFVELTQLTNSYHIARILNTPTIGASGAIYGLLLAYGYFFPNNTIYIYFLFPIKAKYFVILLALMELYLGILNNPDDNVAHFAHLGGALAGFITIKYWQRRR